MQELLATDFPVDRLGTWPEKKLIILYNAWVTPMKHVDVLQGCAIRRATVQTSERQGRH